MNFKWMMEIKVISQQSLPPSKLLNTLLMLQDLCNIDLGTELKH
jgi:hypothetical protein